MATSSVPELDEEVRQRLGRRFGSAIDAWFAARPYDKAVEALTAADVPHSPIMSMADVFTDPHYRAREMLIDVPAEGFGTLPQPGVIPKLSLTPGRVDHAGAALGRHTDEILSGWLDLSTDEIARLREQRVI